MTINKQDKLLLDSMHIKVKKHIWELFLNWHYTDCARNIAIFIEEEIKELHFIEQNKTIEKPKEMFWTALIQSAFCIPQNTLTICNLSTISWENKQKWYKDIFCWFITWIRNPLWHTTKMKLEKQEVIWILFLASLLLFQIDNRLI